MAKNQIFTASECSVTAWAADASGLNIAGDPVWIGAAVESMGLKRSRTLIRRWPTEGARARRLAIDETFVLTFRRLWVVRKSDRADFNPSLQQRYILALTWLDRRRGGQWVRRTFTDCLPVEMSMESEGLMQYYGEQSFDCGGYTGASGTGTAPGSGADAAALAAISEQAVLFLEEQTIVSGQYLLGHYLWPAARTIKLASVIAIRPFGSSAVLTLEIGGVLQATTLTITAGGGEASVSSAALSLNVPANTGVRWKCTAGPSGGTALSRAGLVMQVA